MEYLINPQSALSTSRMCICLGPGDCKEYGQGCFSLVCSPRMDPYALLDEDKLN